jgi:hypothetical protein
VFPQAVIDAGDVALMKLVGEDWKVTDSRSGGAVVEDEVRVAVWYGCVIVVWVTD